MTVKELIEMLSKYPPELEVCIQGPPHEGWLIPEDARIRDNPVDSGKVLFLGTSPFLDWTRTCL